MPYRTSLNLNTDLTNHVSRESFPSTDRPNIRKQTLVSTTFDPAVLGPQQTLSNGNLTVAQAAGAWNTVRSIFSTQTGKFYWEYINIDIHPSGYCMIGVQNSTSYATSYFGGNGDSCVYYGLDGSAYRGSPAAWGNTFNDGDDISVALDLDNLACYFAKNGVWQNSSDPESGSSRTGAHNPRHYPNTGIDYYAAIATYGSTVGITGNFGGSSFVYTVPSGYAAGFGVVS